jgi:predicted O-linked N-acetylglucosamine transferase (SPINDLY family)
MKHKPGRTGLGGGHGGGRVAGNIQARLSPLIRLVEQGKYFEVVPAARDLLRLLPNHPYVLKALSFGLIGQRDYDAALPVLEQAVRQNAKDPELYNNLGICLTAVLRWDEAVDCFDRSLALDGNDPEVWKNKGEAFCHMNRWGEAVPFLLKAVELYPGDFDAAINTLAQALANSGRREEAFVCYSALSEDAPDNPIYLGNLIFSGLATCRWDGLTESVQRLRVLTEDFECVGIAPLNALAIPGLSAAELRRIAEVFSSAEIPPYFRNAPSFVSRRDSAGGGKGRLRIGYASYDLVKDHPVAHVIPQVIELHDRTRVEIFVYSMGPDDGSAIRQRLAGACEHFVDIGALGMESSAARIAQDNLDILVDLQGWTTGGRPAALARRVAPIQANWVGYAGTMGMKQLADYLIADPIVIPAEHEKHFVERIARLPHCYLPMDATQAIANAPSRTEAGLPEAAFVFCSMNNRYKFNPHVFDVWCRLLNQTPGSCLWLTRPNGPAADNLVREAVVRGVSAERIIFAPYAASRADHLARMQLADVALDPSPYNSHSSGIDTLWAGVPMVTLLGETFAGRVGASLVTAAGMPECVTRTWDEYLELCVNLYSNPQRLLELRARLVAGRSAAPLFDMKNFVRSLEDLYFTMWAESQNTAIVSNESMN